MSVDTADFERFIDGMRDELGALSEEALGKAGLVVLADAQEHAPIELGNLRASGVVDAEGGEVVIAFTAEYAARQHEELTWHHPQGGEAKYLENALRRAGGGEMFHEMKGHIERSWSPLR